MYTDDTSSYVICPNPDMAAASLNFIQNKVTNWCPNNYFNSTPGQDRVYALKTWHLLWPLTWSIMWPLLIVWALKLINQIELT